MHVGLDKPARLTIRLFFGFSSDVLLNSKEISANTKTAMLDPSHTGDETVGQFPVLERLLSALTF